MIWNINFDEAATRYYHRNFTFLGNFYTEGVSRLLATASARQSDRYVRYIQTWVYTFAGLMT